MKHLSFILLLLAGLQLSAQNPKFALEASYPVPFDDNFLGRNFNGILDLGMNYRFVSKPLVDVGIALNGSIYRSPDSNDATQPFDVTIILIQPMVFGELNIVSTPKFHPSIGIGYSFLNSEATNINPFVPGNVGNNRSENENGFSFNLGVAYDISSKLFAHAQYDFTKLNINGDVPDVTFNSNINIFKLGLGFRF